VHAGIGQQLTVEGTITSTEQARLNQLLSIANANHGGVNHGFRHDGGSSWTADRAGETATTASILADASAGRPVTFTLVPAGTQTRLALDIDDDGVLNRDEAGSQPTSTSGTVTFTDGSAASGVRLNLFTENRAQFLAVDFTAANGTYTFTLPGPGCYVTTFIAPEGQTFAATGSRFQNRSYCATAGQNVTGINAQINGGASSATFGGRVTQTGGAAVSGVKAVIYQAAADGSRGQWLGPAFTNTSGDWRSTRGAGCYVVDMVAPTGRTWTTTGTGFLQQSFCVSAGQTLTNLNGTLN
jgi:hypothetical protein